MNPLQNQKIQKQARGPSGTSHLSMWLQKDSRRDISLMIPRTHLLLIALIVGATNERTTIDNSQNLWMQFQQLVRFVFKTLITYANSAISLAISLGFC